jgi:hypothetical protein
MTNNKKKSNIPKRALEVAVVSLWTERNTESKKSGTGYNYILWSLFPRSHLYKEEVVLPSMHTLYVFKYEHDKFMVRKYTLNAELDH